MIFVVFEASALIQGTLEMLILRTLALGPLHGLGIADRLAQVTRGTLQVKPGSFFPALYRLEADGLIKGTWGESKTGRRAKIYSLTRAGRKQLSEKKKSWARAALAIQQVLDMS
jgi:PadR family transcriptional regulator PadR